jgi:hypothetical protein
MKHKLLIKKNTPESQLRSGEVRISAAICRGDKFKRRDAIKIHINGHSIIRELLQTNFKEDAKFIEMDYDSRKELGITDIYGRQGTFELKRVNKFWLYWHHPSHGIRLTFQIGIPGLIIAALSLIATFYPAIIPANKANGLPASRQIDTTVTDTARIVEESTAK